MPTLDLKKTNSRAFGRVASKMTHTKPFQTKNAFVWVFGLTLANHPYLFI